MASINGITLFSLKGFQEPPGLVIEDVSRPGVSGVAYRRLHTRGDVFEMIAELDCDNLAAANLQYIAFKELQGTLVTFVDDYAQTANNVMVLDVRRLEQFPIQSAVGGVSTSKGAWLVAGFTLQRTGSS